MGGKIGLTNGFASVMFNPLYVGASIMNRLLSIFDRGEFLGSGFLNTSFVRLGTFGEIAFNGPFS